MSIKKVLISPAHYLVDYNSRSEYYFVGKIIQGLALRTPDIQYYIICGKCKCDLPSNVQIEEVLAGKGAIDLNVLTRSLFYIKVFFRSIKLSTNNKFDLIWHLLPNGRFSFNPFIFFQIDRVLNPDIKRVIGRLQYAKHDLDCELVSYRVDTTDMRGIESKKAHIFLQRVLFKCLLNFSNYYFKLFDLLIFNNNSAIDHYREHILKSLNKPMIKIPVAVDMGSFPFCEKRLNGKIVMLYAGNLDKRKRVDEVLRICKELNYLGCDFELNIVGDGDKKNELVKMVDDFKLRDRVIFFGNVPKNEMYSFYKKAHYLFSLSDNESFGQVFIESWASGTIFIGSKIPVYTEVIRDGQNGILFDVESRDYIGCAKKIMGVDQNEFTKITRNAHEESKLYDWSRVIEEYYDQVISKF